MKTSLLALLAFHMVGVFSAADTGKGQVPPDVVSSLGRKTASLLTSLQQSCLNDCDQSYNYCALGCQGEGADDTGKGQARPDIVSSLGRKDSFTSDEFTAKLPERL
jgi:hypothetical protein